MIVYILVGAIGIVGFGTLFWLNRHIYGEAVASKPVVRPEPVSGENYGSDRRREDQQDRDIRQNEV